MKFPVDLLADVSQADLERSAHNYMNSLLFSDPDSPEHLTLSDSTQVTIGVSSVGFIPLYGFSDKHKLLALFSPSDHLTAVALYLLDQWWTVNDILKTADPARNGAMEVETVGERIVLYMLNRVIYRAKERSTEELPFLCHEEKDYAKILWNNGEAVGFYSVKPTGSLYKSHSMRSYQLPVMDSIFVRKCQRGKGFGLKMLEDFVLSFKEDSLGLRYPLTKSMYKVCKKYLCQYPEDTDLLWEVEGIGWFNQRTNIASKVQAMDLSTVSKSLSFTEESLMTTEVTERDVEGETVAIETKEVKSMEFTVEIVEEVTIVRSTRVSGEGEVPVVVRGRSSGSKRRHSADKTTEDKPEKVIRIEDIEAETPEEKRKTELQNASELDQTEGVFSMTAEEKDNGVVDTAAEEESMTVDKLDSEDATAAPMTEKPQESDAPQDLTTTSNDSDVIVVENVASEIEDAEKNTGLTVSEDLSEEHKKGETVDEVIDGPEIEASNEKLEASQPEDQKEITFTKGDVTVEDLPEKEKPQYKDDLPREEEGTEKEEEPGLENNEVKKNSTDLPVTTEPALTKESEEKVTFEPEKVQKDDDVEISVIQDEQEVSDEETEEPPVVHRRALRARRSAKSKPKKQRKRDQTEKEEHTDEADVGAGGSAEEKVDVRAADKENEEQHQVEEEVTVDKAMEISNEETMVVTEDPLPQAEDTADDVTPTPEMNVERSKEAHEEEEAEGEAETMEADKDKQTILVTEDVDNTTQEPNIVPAAIDTVKSDEVQDEPVVPTAETLQEKDIACKIPRLSKATVILVDIKTACPHLGINDAEETTADGECATLGHEEMELMTAQEEKEVAEEQTLKPEMLTTEPGADEVTQKNTPEKCVDAEVEAVKKDEFEEDNSEKETGEIPVIEARVLRSGRKTVEAGCKTRGTSNQQQEEDNTGEGITENKMDEPEAGTVENEMEVVTKDAVTVMSSQEENESAVPEECAGDGAEGNLPPSEVNESVEVEEPPVVETRALRRGPKTITATPTQRIPRSRKQVEEQEAENSEEEAAVTTRTLRRGRVSALATPKGRSKTSKQIREDKKEEEESASVKDIAVEKTNEEIEEKNEEIGEKIQEEATSEKVEGLEIEIDGQEGKDGQNVMEEQSDREAENFGEEHNDSVTAGAGVTAAADDLVEEKDTDPPLAECNTDPTAPAPSEEEATPSTEEHSEKTASEVSDLQRVTVVLVDLKNASSAILDETAAVEEDGTTEKTDVEAEEEHEEEAMTEEETVAKEDVPVSSEMENVVEEGDGLEEKVVVVDVATPQEDAGEVSVEETEATAVDETDEEEPAVTETRSLRNRKQAAKDTPRCKSARGRQKRGGEEKEEAAEVSEEEAEGGEESAGDEKKEAEEKEEHNQEQQQMIDQEKEERLGENETEMVEQGADISADEAVAQQDVPEEGQVGNTETTEAPAADVAEEAAESQGIVEKEQVFTSDEKQTAAGESEQETLLTAVDEKANNVSEEEEDASVSTRILRSGKKAVRAKSRPKTTKTQAREEDVEVAGEKSTEEDESEVETRVLRKGRRSAAATPRYKSKRVRTQKPEEEAEEVSTPAEDTEADEEENSDEKKEDGEGIAQKDENTEPELETVAEESLTEQETAGEDQCATSQTCTDGLTEASAGETPNTDEGKVTDEEEAPVFEARILRSGKKAVKSTARSETPKNQEEENVEDGTEGKKSSEARVLRRGRRSAPATPRHKSKRARTQHLLEEEEAEVTSPAEDTEEEEEQAGDKSPEKKEEAEGQMEVETNKDLEEENVETAAGGESVVGDAEQMMDATTKEATVLDEEDSVAADETGLDTVQIPSAEADGTNSEEESAAAATVAASDTATAEEEAQVDDTNVAGQEEAPAGATRTLRSKTKTSHAMPSKRQKNQEEMEAQQQEDEETQEDLYSLTENSAENKKPSVQEPAETEKTSQAEHTVESQAEDEADVIDNRETPAGQPATEERQSSDKDSSGESAEKTAATKGRNLRKGRRKKTAKTHVLQRRSRRKRPRVDYSENNDEDDREETETATDKEEEDNTESDEDKDDRKDECSSKQIDKQEENSKEENKEKYEGAVQNTGENSATLNLVLDTDEEAETVASSQEHEEDEQSLSEEEDETIVIDKKVLRGRLVPSITITPQAKHRRRSAKALTAGGEKSPQSARKRSPRKRQSSEVTPAYKSRRRSRI